MRDGSLPYLTAEVPGIGGIIRGTPEDFRVEECPLYLPSGVGEHLYVRITKRGLATTDLVAYLSSRLGVKAKAIGVAGLKDANAVSTQMVSLHGVTPESAARVKHDRVLALEVLGWHRNRLRPGHHAGNRFRLVIRRVHPHASDSVPVTLNELGRRGIPNYFGPQRQGRTGLNYQVGARLVQDRLRSSRMPKAKRLWYLHSYQSFLFNNILARRIESLDRVYDGDWAMKHVNGACFHVEDATVEQARAEAFEISPTGPLFGSRSPWATGEPGEIERAAVAELGQTTESLQQAAAAYRFRGERRALRVPLRDLEWAVTHDTVTISFSLPPGSYATSVLRELMKGDEPGASPETK